VVVMATTDTAAIPSAALGRAEWGRRYLEWVSEYHVTICLY
jgi:hypothetical protein